MKVKFFSQIKIKILEKENSTLFKKKILLIIFFNLHLYL